MDTAIRGHHRYLLLEWPQQLYQQQFYALGTLQLSGHERPI
ncbi:hypothetical protein [Fibrella rubiginis]|nr:hypothetical protein [Fibrella rubiginis]